MSEAISGLLALTTGLSLGVLFFGGLWLTVHLYFRSRHRAPIFAVSLVLRGAIVLAGFYFSSSDGAQTLALCICGFLLARSIVIRSTQLADGIRHAS